MRVGGAEAGDSAVQGHHEPRSETMVQETKITPGTHCQFCLCTVLWSIIQTCQAKCGVLAV